MIHNDTKMTMMFIVFSGVAFGTWQVSISAGVFMFFAMSIFVHLFND